MVKGRDFQLHANSHLVIALTQEAQLLCLLVHEDAVHLASLDGANLNTFVAPAHDVAISNQGCNDQREGGGGGQGSVRGISEGAGRCER